MRAAIDNMYAEGDRLCAGGLCAGGRCQFAPTQITIEDVSYDAPSGQYNAEVVGTGECRCAET